MTWHVIEPRDPLMVRDGRPFGLDTDGVRSLDFPPPSVIAGALRTRIWHQRGGWTSKEAKAVTVRGPILAELGDSEGSHEALFAAPRDCVLFDDQEKAGGWDRFALHPVNPWANGDTSLPPRLSPVGPVNEAGLPDGKPAKAPPAFWRQQALEAWLKETTSAKDRLEAMDGRGPLLHERRVHVAMEATTGTGEDGKLFQTDGLRFGEFDVAGGLRGTHRLALLADCDHPDLKPGLMTLGGERRLSLFARLPGSPPLWSAPTVAERARVVLLTPAVFGDGGIPQTIFGAQVVAAAVGRPQVISGWDMAMDNGKDRPRGGPKATRRMAPAGSVYWVELGGIDAAAWTRQVHLQAISDDAQDRQDGFGLAAVGVWS